MWLNTGYLSGRLADMKHKKHKVVNILMHSLYVSLTTISLYKIISYRSGNNIRLTYMPSFP